MSAQAEAGRVTGLPQLTWLKRAPVGIASRRVPRPRLCVLSGTFNPPTRAHLAMAEAALALPCDEVLFVLPEVSPHKAQLEAPLEDRATMLKLALGDAPKLSAALATHGLFIDIYRALEPHYPADTEVEFLVGRDAAVRILLEWPYADLPAALEQMFARFAFRIAARGGEFEVPEGAPAARFRERIRCLRWSEDLGRISSTLVRRRAAAGESLVGLVPHGVAGYVVRRGLYGAKAGG
jgi:nicotinate-nucleotide adenylyltransferase